jgi:hypothetical protein
MKTAYGPKIFFSVTFLFLGSFTRGQEITSVPAAKAACGPENIKFDVSLDQSQPNVVDSTSGKAMVYILQDFPSVKSMFHFTTRVGVDAAWAGANKDRSYFGFLIDPGVHHLCVSGQWSGPSPSIALHRIEAKVGRTYYFAVRFSYLGSGGGILLDLEPVDEDQGQFMLQSSKHSTSHPK